MQQNSRPLHIQFNGIKETPEEHCIHMSAVFKTQLQSKQSK